MFAGILFGLISMVGWGIADFLAARASKTNGTLTTFFWMQIGGLALLFPLAFWFEEGAAWTGIQWMVASVGVILYSAMYLLLYRSFEKGVIAVISPVFSAFVVVAVVVGLVIFRERLSSIQYIAVALVTGGILLASSDWRQVTGLKTGSLTRGLPEAFAAMLVAGVFFSILALLARQVGWFSPVLRIRAASVLLVGLLAAGMRARPDFHPPGLPWLIAAGMIDGVAFLAFNIGIRAAPAALIAPIAGSFSLVTIVLALLFFKERPAMNQWAGIAAIIIGIVVMSVL